MAKRIKKTEEPIEDPKAEKKRPEGRPRAIDSPETLWSLFLEFREYCKENPFRQMDFVGKDGMRVFREKERPVTFKGFEGWLAINNIISNLYSYEQNRDGNFEEFVPIISAIKAVCSGEIIEGALAGVYQQNIAARLVGLSDNSKVVVQQEQPLFPDAGSGEPEE